MKKQDKKHLLEYRDVFLYARITSNLKNSDFDVEMSSPFKYNDGSVLDIYMTNESVVGIGNRNFQRQQLQNNRGILLIFKNNGNNNKKVVGKFIRTKNVFRLYITNKVLPEEIKVLNIINKHLLKNEMQVEISLDEKSRFRDATRLNRGDYVIQMDIDH